MTTTTTRTPQQIDAELAAAHVELDRAERKLAAAMNDVHYAIQDRYRYQGRRRFWVTSDEVALDLCAEEAGRELFGNARPQQALQAYEKAGAYRVWAAQRVADLNEEYTGWSRFFLVPGGHIHSSMSCQTCRPTTRFGWLPEMSGRTEADVVAEHGALLCTVCFPSAPVEWTNHYELQAEAKKAASCAGSGSYLDTALPYRSGYYTGNWATCQVCGERVTITSTGKLRKHK